MSDYIRKSALIDSLIYCDGLGRKSLEAVVKTINEQPTLDKKEIIRKHFERVVERLESIKIGGECRHKCKHYDWTVGACNGECGEYVKSRAIEIVKEECGINE